jgi:hypothetical protein
VSVKIGGRVLHVLASHPTPPAFDGPEDRNGRRNHDEIRLWSDYLSGAPYLVDDAGKRGGFGGGSEQGGANVVQQGDPRQDTADFNDLVAGNLRVDYLLPSKDLRVCGGGVFWPAKADPEARLVWGDAPPPSSDHRLVWIDVLISARGRCPPGSDPTASASSHPRR